MAKYLIQNKTYSRYGYSEDKSLGYNLIPCQIKSINKSWQLLFDDGHITDTNLQSTGKNSFKKQHIINMMIAKKI